MCGDIVIHPELALLITPHFGYGGFAICIPTAASATHFSSFHSCFFTSSSFASAAAADVFVPKDVGATSTSAKRRNSKGKGGRGSGGGSGGGGGGSGSGSGGSGRGGGGGGGGGGSGTGGGGGGSGGGGGGSGGSGGSGGCGTSGGRSGPQRGGPGGRRGQHQQRRSETQTPQQLREWLVQRGQLLQSGVAIFDLDFDAIISAMYALSFSAEGDCYWCVPPDLGIAAAALGASASGTPPGTVPAEALHTFTLDSGASRYFFRDNTTLTPLPAPVPVRLADPSWGPIVASSSTVLPCPAVPSGSLSGLHLPSFSTNLVSTAALQDVMVTTTTLGGQRVSICTCTRTGRHLATFTRRPGTSLYTLATEPPQVAASAQVSASGLCLPLPPSPALPSLPCFEGRQCAAPHSSSFPTTTDPLQTLHMDVWGPAHVSGQGRERYFLLVVDDYSRYTIVFPLRSKDEVSAVLIPWIRTVRLQLSERFGHDLPVLRLHSDRGGEFSSDLLRDFIRGEGITQSFTLPDSPPQNGIAERRIGLVMEVARTSMIHAAAPHFLWPFAVRYAAHQLNLWPRVSLPETSPTLRWTGKVGDASVFRVWGSRAFVRDTSAEKLSARAIPYVFLGFVPNAPGWQFYHPTSRHVLPSQDVTFDESVPFYRLFPYCSAPPPPPPLFLAPGPPPVDPLQPQGPAPSRVSQVDPLPGPAPVQVAVVSGAAPGTASGGAASGGAASGDAASGEPEGVEPRGAESEGAEPGGAESEGAEPGGAESEGAESGGAEPWGAASSGGPTGASPRLSSQQLRERLVQRAHRRSGAPGAGEPRDAGARGAAVTTGAGDPTEPGAAGDGGPGAEGTRAAGAGAVDPGAGGTGGTVRPRPYFVPLLQQVLGVSSSTGLPPPFLCPPPDQSQPPLQPASPLPIPSPYTEQSGGLTERREPASRPVSLVRTACRAPRLRPPPFPGTHTMALPRAASPTVARLLAIAVSDPSFESAAASALIAELLDFAIACRLDYASALVAESVPASPPTVGGECALGTDVLEDTQEDFECLAAAVPRFASLLLAPEGDPDAPNISTPRSYAEAITGTYVDEVPPPGANIVNGMWIFRVKRPPGSPPAFMAHYVARGFSQRQGVDYFQTFSTTPKMTTLRVLLHVAAQRDYELHSLDFSTAFLKGSLHEEIWLRRPPGFIGTFPAANPTLFLHTDTSLPPFYVLVYVDDLVFATADTEALTLVKSELQKRHTCTDLGELRNYLGLQITRDRARHSLSAPPSDESVELSGPYPELVGCLMYLMTCTRPDLAYPLSLLARYVAPGKHRKVHWDSAKRVLRYLYSTSGMGLVLGGRGLVVLTGHADASWELRWLTYLLTDLGEQPHSPPVLYVGNKAMIALCQEHRLEHRTKHIALRYFLARELQQRGQLRLAYMATRANTADVFTKALPPVSTMAGPEERGGRGAGSSGEAQAQGQPRDSAMAPVQPSLGPPRDEPRVFGLDKFNGDNFAERCFRMENVFDHYDLVEVMEGTKKRPENDSEKSPWVRKSAQGYLLLGQALGSSQIRHIKPFERESEKGPKAWAALKGVYASAAAAVAVVLERQMAALRIEVDEAVEEGVQKFFDLLTRLEGADLNYSELQKKTKMLALLPESWSLLIINLNRDLPRLSLEDVKRAILQEDFRRRELASADGAGAASIGRGHGRGRGRGQWGGRFGSNNFNGGRGSSGYSNDNKNNGRGRGRFDGECHFCHKSGHMWRDCYKLPDGWTPAQGQEGRGAGGGRGRGRGGRGGRGGGAASMKSAVNESESRDDRFSGQFFFVSTQASAGPEKDEGFEEPAAVGKVTLHSLDYWVIDSGATYSMTSRADLLTELEPSPVKHVTSALGQRAEVKGMGKAMFKGADGKMVGLKNVLWVPNLAANLISVRRLQKAGMDTSLKGAKTYTVRLGERILWDLHEDRDVYNEMWQIPVVPMPKERQVAASISTKGTSKLGEYEESGAAAKKQHKGEENPKAAAEEEYGENMWGTIASAAFSNPTLAMGECDWLTLHRRMGHVALLILQQLVKNEMVAGIRVKGEPDEVLGCPACMQAKFTRYPFSSSEATAKAPLDEVVMDVVGPLKLGAAGAEYFLTIVDVYTRMTWVYVLSKKSDVAETVKTDWLPMVERQQDRLLKAIRTDRGGEFLSKEFELWLKKNGIRHSLTMPYSPAMNGIAERANRTITETARGALTHVGADKWVPYVEWIGRKPKVDMLRVPWARGRGTNRPSERAATASNVPSYRTIPSRNTDAEEEEEEVQQVSERAPTLPSRTTSAPRIRVTSQQRQGLHVPAAEEEGRGKRRIQAPNRLTYEALGKPAKSALAGAALMVGEDEESDYEECAFAFFSLVEMSGEPATLKEALESSDAEKWKKAMESELKSIEENGTCELVELPEGRKAITSKWLFKIKSDVDGKIERYKSRLVAKGYQQKEKWYLKLRGVLEEISFTPSTTDHSLFMLGEGEQRSFMEVYVDDILIFSPSSDLVKEEMLKLQDKFKCKALGDVNFYLGLHIERDVEKRCMRVHQRKYLEALAAKFGQSEGHVATLFPSGVKCVKGPEEESVGEEERRRFHSLVGSLMYAAVNTRPDVAFATGQLARVVQYPNEEQVAAGMRVAKYLGQTPTVGLQYSAAAQRRQKGADGVEPGRLFLTAFSDASYASEPEDMTSVGGFIFCVCGGPTAWESKKQVDQALSSVEFEYMALFRAVREIVWLRRLLAGLGEEQQGPTPLYCDSQGAIALAKNPVLHGLTKHMRVKWHWTRSMVAASEVELLYVKTTGQPAVMMTKRLVEQQHWKCCKLAGMALN
ncbi:unnamed protein product [Closterium sp. NIES-54]